MSLYAYSLDTLRGEALTRYDLPTSSTSTKPTTAQLTSMVNNSIRRFTNKLLALFGDDYLTTMSTIATSAGVATVPLPARCFRLQGISWIRSSQDRIRLRRATVDDLLDGGASPSDPQAWECAPKYTLLGQTVSFVPVPSAVYSLRVVYAQLLADLSADGDTVELGPGWDEWILSDVCRQISIVREESPDRFIQDLKLAEADILEAAGQRDDNEPPMARRLFDAGVRGMRDGDLEGEYS